MQKTTQIRMFTIHTGGSFAVQSRLMYRGRFSFPNGRRTTPKSHFINRVWNWQFIFKHPRCYWLNQPDQGKMNRNDDQWAIFLCSNTANNHTAIEWMARYFHSYRMCPGEFFDMEMLNVLRFKDYVIEHVIQHATACDRQESQQAQDKLICRLHGHNEDPKEFSDEPEEELEDEELEP